MNGTQQIIYKKQKTEVELEFYTFIYTFSSDWTNIKKKPKIQIIPDSLVINRTFNEPVEDHQYQQYQFSSPEMNKSKGSSPSSKKSKLQINASRKWYTGFTKVPEIQILQLPISCERFLYHLKEPDLKALTI